MAGPVNPTTLTWDAPQQNTDGTQLTNLKEYHVDISSGASGPWTRKAIVSAAAPDPNVGDTASSLVSSWGLAQGQWYAAVRAVNLNGTSSGESVAVPFALSAVGVPMAALNLRFS